MKHRSIGIFVALVVVLAAYMPQAMAHPHIFVDAKAEIVFDEAGKMVAIRHVWSFDEAYSSWSMQGLDTDLDGVVSRAEAQELADENLVGLREYGFYSFAGEGGTDIAFPSGSNAAIDYVDGRQTLSFEIAPDAPYMIRDELVLAIADSEYYVAIDFASADDVTLVNAPANCAVQLREAVPLSDDIANQLYDLSPDVTTLPVELARALLDTQGAVLINCPGGSGTGLPVPERTSTALDAATALADTAPPAQAGPPLGGPPPEPGLQLPRTGLLGWVQQQQADFYEALVKALDALRRDGNAFWVLGGLSFLYGVFHAAGPGHGKVVISSYVLANEAQVRRGVLLSFLSAMLQSVVAIGFVLIAAAVLGLSGAVMNDATHWIGVVSYALVALLGLWLVARKLLGWGHGHAHDHAHDHGHHHDHGAHGHEHAHHDHGHAHVVTAEQVRGGWREQLGVALAVGLRPCSGALVVLAFALSQGLLAAGIAAVLLMGLGTALTTGVLAALAVGAKGVAMRLAGTDNGVAGAVLWWVELAAALAVLAFGVLLLLASF